jgi:hypothetical protein
MRGNFQLLEFGLQLVRPNRTGIAILDAPECMKATMMSQVLNVPCQNRVRHFVLLLFSFLVKLKI